MITENMSIAAVNAFRMAITAFFIGNILRTMAENRNVSGRLD